jgi:hypothetical protein
LPTNGTRLARRKASKESRGAASPASAIWSAGREAIPAIYGWFTEGFVTADLKDAKALLDELNE